MMLESETFKQSIRPYVESGLFSARLFSVFFAALLLLKAWPEIDAMVFVKGSVTLAVGAAGFVIVVASIGWLISLIWTVEIDSRGVRGSTYWGWHMRATWGDIERVDFVSFTGVSYLSLSVRGKKLNLYIPAALQQGGRFGDLVVAHAGPDHPLSEWYLPEENVAVAP